MKWLCLMLTAVSLASACTPRGFRPPPDIEETYTSAANPTPAQIKITLDECGFSRPLQRIGSESLDNARTRIEECLFAKGFYYKSGWGGSCSIPEYRSELPACQNAPIRPRNGYYGK